MLCSNLTLPHPRIPCGLPKYKGMLAKRWSLCGYVFVHPKARASNGPGDKRPIKHCLQHVRETCVLTEFAHGCLARKAPQPHNTFACYVDHSYKPSLLP